jgi:predicted nuclease of predicted toxin-antitoxin system
MRILIDECLDERLRNFLPDHDCQTARYAGFAGLKNGELIEAAEKAKFEALLTLDQGFEFEQNLRGRKIAILIFRTRSSRLKDILPHVPRALKALKSIKPGQVIQVGE